MDRKDFFKNACLTGFCLCGFGAIAGASASNSLSEPDTQSQLGRQWLAILLSNLSSGLDEDTLRAIIKKSAMVHYHHLNMDALLADYIGDLEKFNHFIENSWGWKIDYNKVTNLIIADENKNHCVCPILEHSNNVNTSAICYCSEGFAEKMFSTIIGNPVKATVIASIRKGDTSCKYKIEIP